MIDLMDKLSGAETECVIGFKQHILDTAHQLISSIKGNSLDKPCMPVQSATAATGHTSALMSHLQVTPTGHTSALMSHLQVTPLTSALSVTLQVTSLPSCPQQCSINDSHQPEQIMAAAENPQITQVLDNHVHMHDVPAVDSLTATALSDTHWQLTSA